MMTLQVAAGGFPNARPACGRAELEVLRMTQFVR
jgi:hypothetical protein